MSIGNDAKMDSETLVVLVHGFCRNGQNMQYWRESLSEVFSNVICADMPATHGSFQDCLQSLENTVAEYIDFFNNMRPHKKLGNKSPNQFEIEYLQLQELKKEDEENQNRSRDILKTSSS